MMSRRWLVPEVIQTSAMDCGPAALKALLEGHGIAVSYGRLREACHTDVDGTSIDALEELAIASGLDAEQVMEPLDHLLLSDAELLPAVVVVEAAGHNHFVVAWRSWGPFVQVMDPGTGRRWMTRSAFMRSVFRHEQALAAAAVADWLKGQSMLRPLRTRLRLAGVNEAHATELLNDAVARQGWQGVAALDAAVRLATDLQSPVLADLAGQPHLIPRDYWTVVPADDEGEVVLRGAVAVRCAGRVASRGQALPPTLAAALDEPSVGVAAYLWQIVREDGWWLPVVVMAVALVTGASVLIESALLRALFEIGPHFAGVGPRAAALLLLVIALTTLGAIEWAGERLTCTIGRRLDVRLRWKFAHKLPRLDDRFLQSRLIADLAQRVHSTHLLRNVPHLVIGFARTASAVVATVAGIAWFFPSALWPALTCAVVSIAVPLAAQSLLSERDLRFREHTGALTRFYLDALAGIVPIRTHGAGPALRYSQGVQLERWASARLRLQRSVVSLEAVQMTAGYGAAAWCVWSAMRGAENPAALLLLLYWTLSLPALGQSLAATAWQWPGLQNTLMRLHEPLSTPEAAGHAAPGKPSSARRTAGVGIECVDVSVIAGGHSILHDVTLSVAPGEHVAIVGASGAGKSSLVGLLLGWQQPASGSLRVDGDVLDQAGLAALRAETAWIDPQVQLWNAPLTANLGYGLAVDQRFDAHAIERAHLGSTIARLPLGMQTPLGEGGARLSGGEGQRVRAARAFGKPGVRLAILDEPARGLDREMRGQIVTQAREVWADATLLCVTHDVTSALAFPRVLVIEDGTVREDGVPSVLLAEPSSAFHRLCRAEDHVRARHWGAPDWQRATLIDGRLVRRAAGRPEQQESSCV